LMAQCESYLVEHGYFERNTFTATPHPQTPYFIIMWIMDVCDEVKLDSSTQLKSEQHATYTHAMKMHAAMTYAFGHVHQLGSMDWYQSSDAGWKGNPSVSNIVSTYSKG
ncbi:hypothetical protein P691DRAFT_687537, partial [Macrolepiota fuliginosa MF-IS2]